MSFNFKLQTLLDIRIKEEDESKIFYSKTQQEKKEVEDKLNRLEENYKKYYDISTVKDTITQKITMHYLSSLNENIKDTTDELAKKEKKVNEARADLMDKTIKRKTLETLKENQKAEFEKEENRLEQLSNDEFALYGYVRRLSNF
jgi:flagellar FliJ protein